MTDSRTVQPPPSSHQVSKQTWLLIGLVLIIAFAFLSWAIIIPNAINRAQDDRDTLEAALTAISNAKEQSTALSRASSDLQAEVASLGSAINAIPDTNVKSTLQREFGPVSENARRIDAMAAAIAGAYQRFGSATGPYPRYAMRINLWSAVFEEARAGQKGKGGGGQPSNSSIDLRKKYEDTVQQQQKIKLFEHTFYGLAALGVLILLAAILAPAAAATKCAETAKIYLPALLSSWATFMATISI
jgi:hypothetical protein